MRAAGRPALNASVLVQLAPPPIPPREAAALLRALGRRLRVPHRTVTALFTDDEAVRRLNRDFRGKDRVTDVLSFPSGEPTHLGDIAIASPRTRQQARAARRRADEEARRLLLHGFLHLLGYDHEADDGEMDQMERTLRREMKGGEL